MSDEMLRPNLKYTREHEWVLEEGDVVTLGITHFAQESLGDVVYIELPEVGATFDEGDHFAVVESVKAASEVYTPFAGTITEVNEALEASPEIVNDSPYDEGWLVKIKPDGEIDEDELMDAEAYEAFIDALD